MERMFADRRTERNVVRDDEVVGFCTKSTTIFCVLVSFYAKSTVQFALL